MDKIEKFLARLSPREREALRLLLVRLSRGEYKGLDIKKLKGRSDIFRIRKGDIRIIYRVVGRKIFILAIERRGEKTYNNI